VFKATEMKQTALRFLLYFSFVHFCRFEHTTLGKSKKNSYWSNLTAVDSAIV